MKESVSQGKARRIRTKEIRDHRDLRVWRKARKLGELCELACSEFPPGHEQTANTIRRLANEVADEIAAGQSRGQFAHYMEHLERSRHAVRHLERWLIDAHEAGCFAVEIGDPILARAAEIVRMLGKLMVSLELAHARRRAERDQK